MTRPRVPRLPRRRPGRRAVVVGVVGVVVLLVLGGLLALPAVRDRIGIGVSYCAAVESHQAELSDTLAPGTSSALLQALPTLEELRSKAPDDIADEWQQVTTRLEALRSALVDAGVDPAAYDAAKPPSGLSTEQRAAITAAATQLGSPATTQAFDAVQQEVLDVCHTPLAR